MSKRFRLPLLTAAVVLLLASCGKNNKQGKLVPKDAMIVLHIDGASLTSKLPWDEIKKNDLFKELYADTTLPPFIKSLLDNPENSGIDVKNDLIGYAAKDSIGGYAAIEGTVKDAAKFSTFNTFVTKGGTPSEKDGMNFISSSPMCVGWTKDKFVYVVDLPNMMNMGRNYGMSSPKEDKLPRDVGATCRAVFALKEENSMAKEEKFSSLMSDKGDMHFYINTNEIMNGSGMMGGMMSMTKVSDLYKDAVSTGTFSFDNGKINMDYKSYPGKAMADIFSKYEGSSISEEMFKRYGGKNIAGAMAINFKPEVIREILKISGTEGFANLGLAKYGLSVDDFIKANKGDIFIAASDIKAKTDTFRYGTGTTDFSVSNKPDVKYIFAVSINDKNAFNSLIKAAQKLHGEMGGDDSAAKAKGVNFNVNDKYFAIGNDKALVDQYITGGNNSFDFFKNISGNPVGGYVNIQGIMQAVGSSNIKDSSDKASFDASIKMWQDIYIKGGNYSNGAMTQHMEVNLVDKNTNSLQQLNKYLATIAQIETAKKKKMEAEYMTDTVRTIRADSVVSNH